MDLSNITKILNYASQAAQLMPAVAQSVAKVTDPNATVADKLAAVQKDVQVGHAIASANSETTQTFDELWAAASPIINLLIGFL